MKLCVNVLILGLLVTAAVIEAIIAKGFTAIPVDRPDW
jgi:hypothetical protein